jgi:hypothetical protein
MILIIVIAVLVALALIAICCVLASGRCSRQEEARQAQPIADKPNPSHDPEIPPVVAVTPKVKLTPSQALAAANAYRAQAALTKAVNCAKYLATGRKPEEALIWYDYSSVGSMRKALNHHGYSITGQPLKREDKS